VLTLSFPENYTWALEFGGDGLAHHIYHPQEPLEELPIAVVGGHALLPGLRWAEVKQMVACLQPTWPATFALQTVYPLLYPIVDPVTFAEYDEVRQTLGTAWEALQVVKPSQLEGWLDVSISVYEKGRIVRYDAAHGWQALSPSGNVNEEKLWLADRAGDWFCTSRYSMRRYGSHDIFTPFFDMLERHTQPHT
jgi:hypothetical protein